MGRYNEFCSKMPCPSCGQSVELVFQAHIGALDWAVYQPNDLVRLQPEFDKRPIIGPAPEAWSQERPFWAWGLAECPACGSSVDGKVVIREGQYAGIELWVNRSTGEAEWGWLEEDV